MKPPSSQARLILERYKAAESLRVDEKARLGEAIRERALRGDLPRFDIQPTSPAVPRTGWAHQVWSSLAGKAGLALVVLGAGAGVAYQLRKDAAAPGLIEPAPPTPGEREVAPTFSTEPAPAPRAEPGAATSNQPPPSPPRAKPERQLAAPLTSASEPTIDEEVKLVKAAQAALQAGDAKRALRLLDEDAARFPSGKLTSVRQVAHMTALCQAGQREQAQQEAASFLAKNPSSPFADRVKAICR